MNKSELLILRHAKSAWDTDAPNDFQRPLNKRGHKSARKMGQWMSKHIKQPLYVYSSSALRAWQTASIVCYSMNIPEEEIQFCGDLYLASSKNICKRLSMTPESVNRVLLVGHNPGLEELLKYLIDNSLPEVVEGKVLPTATLATVTISGSWNNLTRGCGSMADVYRPEN